MQDESARLLASGEGAEAKRCARELKGLVEECSGFIEGTVLPAPVVGALSGSPGPVVVLAHHTVAGLPWESLPCLNDCSSVARDFSLHVMASRHALSRALSVPLASQAAGVNTASQPCGAFAAGDRAAGPFDAAGFADKSRGTAVGAASRHPGEHIALPGAGGDPRDTGMVPPASGAAVGFVVDPFMEAVAAGEAGVAEGEVASSGAGEGLGGGFALVLRRGQRYDAGPAPASVGADEGGDGPAGAGGKKQSPKGKGKDKGKGKAKGGSKKGSPRAGGGEEDEALFPSSWAGVGGTSALPSAGTVLELLQRQRVGRDPMPAGYDVAALQFPAPARPPARGTGEEDEETTDAEELPEGLVALVNGCGSESDAVDPRIDTEKASGGGFIFAGPGPFAAAVPASSLAGACGGRSRFAWVGDRCGSQMASRRVLRHRSGMSREQVALEGWLGTAALLTLAGVQAVVCKPWASTVSDEEEALERFAGWMDSGVVQESAAASEESKEVEEEAQKEVQGSMQVAGIGAAVRAIVRGQAGAAAVPAARAVFGLGHMHVVGTKQDE